MTAFDLIALAKAYDNIVTEYLDNVVTQGDPQIMHVSTILQKIITEAELSIYLIDPKKSKYWDRANRDMGFVRGVLWSRGIINSSE